MERWLTTISDELLDNKQNTTLLTRLGQCGNMTANASLYDELLAEYKALKSKGRVKPMPLPGPDSYSYSGMIT